MKPAVVVLFNEPMREHEPSEAGVVSEVEDVVAALESCGKSVESRSMSSGSLLSTLGGLAERRAGTVVFNLCEGLDGHSQWEPLLAGLLEIHGIRFTGNTATTLSWALDKRVATAILRAAGVPTLEGWVFQTASLADVPRTLPFPCIVKPVGEDGSMGITIESVVRNVEELRERVSWVVETYRQPALVERYLPGREFNMSVVGEGSGTRVLPAAEIVFEGYGAGEYRVLSHDAKWHVGSRDDLRTIPRCPASVDERLGTTLASLSLATYRAFGCRDYARIDIRLDGDGTAYVIDVNPNPDISRVAGLALAAAEAGFTYERLVNNMMETAWKRPL
ncbi:MAG: hypothetical protein MUE60_04155 [Candidatus Eisenbacteria bacterium]|nr:hypothetical protein [Candidatus Eisenbacteria bacterium]